MIKEEKNGGKLDKFIEKIWIKLISAEFVELRQMYFYTVVWFDSLDQQDQGLITTADYVMGVWSLSFWYGGRDFLEES